MSPPVHMDRRDNHWSEIPPLLVFLVVLVSGAGVLQFARAWLHLGPRLGLPLFVALPIVAVLAASKCAHRD